MAIPPRIAGTACRLDGAATEVARINNSVHARFPRYVDFEHDQDRLGLTGSVQWKAGDHTTLSLDVLHSKPDAERSEPFLEAISLARGNATGRGQTDVRDYEIDENGTMVYGLFDNVDTRSENRLDEWNTELNHDRWTLDHEFRTASRSTRWSARPNRSWKSSAQRPSSWRTSRPTISCTTSVATTSGRSFLRFDA